jgi:D-alanyl-D-alanine carboxypeptidase (penicillin-binding protein 5/6)
VCLLIIDIVIFHQDLYAQTSHPKVQSLAFLQSSPQSILPPEEIAVKAKGAVLMDSVTGDILLAHHARHPIPPASFVKLLTLYVIFDALKQHKIQLTDEVHVSKKAWKTGGSKMFIEVNTKVPVEELIKGIAVVSGNDACVAMAEHLYGDVDTFTRVMNRYAQHLGMKDSFFVNPHGLPAADQLTTAYDMALLARHYINQFPEALHYHQMQTYTYNGIEQRNRNGLLKRDDTVDGLKTGWVVKAGYNLVATAKRQNHRLIAVVMGARTPAIREREALKILSYGYQNFTLLTLFKAGQVLAELPVWKGQQDLLPVVATQTTVMLIPREYKDRVDQVQVLPDTIVAPVKKNQVVGKYLINVGHDQFRSIPLKASIGIKKAGIVKLLQYHLYRNGLTSSRSLFVIASSMLSLCAVTVLFAVGKKRRRRQKSRLYVRLPR